MKKQVEKVIIHWNENGKSYVAEYPSTTYDLELTVPQYKEESVELEESDRPLPDTVAMLRES